jgi:hypothetical protein
MKALAWWFRIVGAVYVALGITFLPAINTGRVEMLVPGFDGDPGGPAWDGFVDYLLMFGLEEIVLGSFLVLASFLPRWWEPLVWLLVSLSVVRGIGHDLYMIANGYSVLSNVAFVVLHLAIIGTGVLLLRRWRARGGSSDPRRRAAATTP